MKGVRPGAALCLSLVILFLAQPLKAQSRSGNRSSSKAPVRAELAALLLQSKRYEEAAREYRALLSREPGNNSYRLNLARALAWGKRPREAERELRILSARRPNDREVDALLRTVRDSYEPSAAEAGNWLAERPDYAPYRLAYARALVREGSAVAALPHYETLISSDNSAMLRREAIDAYIDGGEPERALELLRTTLQRAAGDTAARHTLARVLVHTRRYDEALGSYDTLVAWNPTSALLLERAQLNLARRDRHAAEADATASINARQNAPAYLLLSTLQRQRGDLALARVSLERAAQLKADPRAFDAAMAQQTREERPVVAFLPTWDENTDWSARSAAVTDNLGLLYTVAGVRHAEVLPYQLTASLDIELRRMAEPDAFEEAVKGAAISVGLANEIVYGPLLLRFGARGGFAQQAQRATPTVGLAASGWLRAWAVSLEHSRAPAYPTLFSVATVRDPDLDDPLTERSSSVALGGPLGLLDAAVFAQRSAISDGNQRTTLQGQLRWPVLPGVTLITAVTGIWFEQRSALYWDPVSYLAGAAGLEYSVRQPSGVSLALRALAGPARSVEEVPVDEFELAELPHSALQLSGGAELSYRMDAGELGAAVAYGSGRAGDYRRLEAMLFIRRLR